MLREQKEFFVPINTAKGHDRKFIVLMTLCSLFGALDGCTQNPSRKYFGDKHQAYYDSLKDMKYDQVFPLLGDKAYKRGFDIPFPFGIMINNFYGIQGIDITNVNIGLKGPGGSFGPVNVSNIVQFNDVNTTLYNVNVRMDAYIFPFFNVYGLISYMPYSVTHVELSEPLDLTAEPQQDGWAYGFGGMLSFGFGPIWLSADYNMTWADMQFLDNRVFTQITGLRVGHVFTLNADPQKNFSVWVGMMGMFLNNNTQGQVKMSEIFPAISQQQVNDATQNYSTSPAITPVQKDIMDKIMEKLSDRIHGISVDDNYITYQMDKHPTSTWAGLVGAQYQFNKRWQLRSESNFISGDRLSIMLSLNYRFLGFKKSKQNP